jgi:putative colanic acid biosynthesis UDP-glucose lipid carrier transferase
MYFKSRTDFLSIRLRFRYALDFAVPVISVVIGAYCVNWLSRAIAINWPILIIFGYGLVTVKFNYLSLLSATAFRWRVILSLFKKCFLLGLIASLAFCLDNSLRRHLSEMLYFCFFVWVIASALTIALIEIATHVKFRKPPRKIAIVAVTETSVAFAKILSKKRFLSLEFVGYFEDRVAERIPDHAPYPILNRIDNISEYLENNIVHDVLISLPTQATFRFDFVIKQLLDSTCSVHYLHDFLLIQPIRAALTPIGEVSVFTIIDTPSSGVDYIFKRIFDIFFSAIAIICLSPLLLVVAFLIKIDSKGPVLFKQFRWGNAAEPFEIYKFRSMTNAVSAQASSGEVIVQTTRNDSRVTRMGSFIRRTSIDELPQLINIFKGDMSVVGPRPHATQHNKDYRTIIAGYMLRHKVKPGLTGWAQVNGFRGETDTLEKMEMRVKYDLQYLRDWTPMLDIYIVFLTIKVVLLTKNAY